MELALLFAAYVGVGAVRPRWTTLLAALVPAALAFGWLLLNADVPGDDVRFVDLAWYAGMSLVVGGVYAFGCAGGVVLGRALHRMRRLPQ